MHLGRQTHQHHRLGPEGDLLGPAGQIDQQAGLCQGQQCEGVLGLPLEPQRRQHRVAELQQVLALPVERQQGRLRGDLRQTDPGLLLGHQRLLEAGWLHGDHRQPLWGRGLLGHLHAQVALEEQVRNQPGGTEPNRDPQAIRREEPQREELCGPRRVQIQDLPGQLGRLLDQGLPAGGRHLAQQGQRGQLERIRQREIRLFEPGHCHDLQRWRTHIRAVGQQRTHRILPH